METRRLLARSGWIASMVVCGFGGGLLGLLTGIRLICWWLGPRDEGCGFLAMLTTGPLGVVLGVLLSAWILRPRPPRQS